MSVDAPVPPPPLQPSTERDAEVRDLLDGAPAPSSADRAWMRVGQVGALAAALAFAAELAEASLSQVEGLIFARAILLVVAFVALGLGFLRLPRLVASPEARIAGALICGLALFASLPIIAELARSASAMRLAVSGFILFGAVAWSLAGFALQSAGERLGLAVKLGGWALLLGAFVDLGVYVALSADLVTDRGAFEIVEWLHRATVGLRVVGLALAAAVFGRLAHSNETLRRR